MSLSPDQAGVQTDPSRNRGNHAGKGSAREETIRFDGWQLDVPRRQPTSPDGSDVPLRRASSICCWPWRAILAGFWTATT